AAHRVVVLGVAVVRAVLVVAVRVVVLGDRVVLPGGGLVERVVHRVVARVDAGVVVLVAGVVHRGAATDRERAAVVDRHAAADVGGGHVTAAEAGGVAVPDHGRVAVAGDRGVAVPGDVVVAHDVAVAGGDRRVLDVVTRGHRAVTGGDGRVDVDVGAEVAAVGVDLEVGRAVDVGVAVVDVAVGDVGVDVLGRGLAAADRRGGGPVDLVAAAVEVAAEVGVLAVVVQDRQRVGDVLGAQVAQAGVVARLLRVLREVLTGFLVEDQHAEELDQAHVFGIPSKSRVCGWVRRVGPNVGPSGCWAIGDPPESSEAAVRGTRGTPR